jgi:hypothetical protein
MAGAGGSELQTQPGNDGGGGSFAHKPPRYRGYLSSEARLGLGLGMHRWHQNIVAPGRSQG